MTASILQQLLALYFTIIYSCQLSRSWKLLVGKKKSSVCLKNFKDLDFFFFFSFFSFSSSLINVGLPYQLRKAYAVLTLILTNFENLNFISNIFQETHDLLVLTAQ